MGEVVRSEFEQLRAELTEIRELLDATLYAIVGERGAAYIEQGRAMRWFRRWESGSPVMDSKVGLGENGFQALLRSDLVTLEEVARRSRSEIAALKGVGPVTIERLDQALAERGLTWAEAA